jgi:hypothetical protein
LEGIVAKQQSGPYLTARENSTWFKIRNREYSQVVGREELLDRERHQEPVAGWHSCVLIATYQLTIKHSFTWALGTTNKLLPGSLSRRSNRNRPSSTTDQ